jgi:hypothetical protein
MIVIDFIYLIFLLVPPVMRNAELTAYLRALTKPIATMHTQFQQFYEDKKGELTWNGQVCMLEEMLNRRFDPTFKRIYIEDQYEDEVFLFNIVEQNEETFVFNVSEPEDVNHPPVYIYNSSELLSGFIIHVPVGLTFNLNLFHYLVRKYKLQTVKYTIVYE